MHRDGNNAGASFIVGLGDYKRGRLLYWAQDNHKRSLVELSQIQPEYMNVKEQPEIFDGRRAHATEDFEGKRYTIIFYAIKDWMDADQHTQESCASVPWQLPTFTQIVQARDALPTPQGYAESKMMIGQTITEMHNFVNGELQ